MVAPQFMNIQVKHTSILYSVFMCAVRNHSLTIWVIITITSCFAKMTQVLEMLKCYRSWSRIYLAFHLQRGLQREEEDFCERRPVSDSEVGSLLLQILVVCADGHKLVLVCGVKFIPWLRVIGLIPRDVWSFGQTDQIQSCTAHSQTDEEELGDEARMLLSMLYCCPKYHCSSLRIQLFRVSVLDPCHQ